MALGPHRHLKLYRRPLPAASPVATSGRNVATAEGQAYPRSENFAEGSSVRVAAAVRLDEPHPVWPLRQRGARHRDPDRVAIKAKGAELQPARKSSGAALSSAQ